MQSAEQGTEHTPCDLPPSTHVLISILRLAVNCVCRLDARILLRPSQQYDYRVSCSMACRDLCDSSATGEDVNIPEKIHFRHPGLDSLQVVTPEPQLQTRTRTTDELRGNLDELSDRRSWLNFKCIFQTDGGRRELYWHGDGAS